MEPGSRREPKRHALGAGVAEMVGSHRPLQSRAWLRTMTTAIEAHPGLGPARPGARSARTLSRPAGRRRREIAMLRPSLPNFCRSLSFLALYPVSRPGFANEADTKEITP